MGTYFLYLVCYYNDYPDKKYWSIANSVRVIDYCPDENGYEVPYSRPNPPNIEVILSSSNNYRATKTIGWGWSNDGNYFVWTL